MNLIQKEYLTEKGAYLKGEREGEDLLERRKTHLDVGISAGKQYSALLGKVRWTIFSLMKIINKSIWISKWQFSNRNKMIVSYSCKSTTLLLTRFEQNQN